MKIGVGGPALRSVALRPGMLSIPIRPAALGNRPSRVDQNHVVRITWILVEILQGIVRVVTAAGMGNHRVIVDDLVQRGAKFGTRLPIGAVIVVDRRRSQSR